MSLFIKNGLLDPVSQRQMRQMTVNRWMWDHLEDMQRKAEHYKRKFVKGHQVNPTY